MTIPGWVWSMLAGMLIGSALVGVGVFGASKPAPQWATSETAGDEAPAFSLRILDGETFRLEEHRGEVVILNFWATWCAPCRVEMSGFVDLQDSFRDEGVQFVGIAVDRDGTAAVRPFVEEEGINVPQIANPSVAARHFPGEAVPRTYLIDKRGRIRYEHSGVMLKWALDDRWRRERGRPAPEEVPFNAAGGVLLRGPLSILSAWRRGCTGAVFGPPFPSLEGIHRGRTVLEYSLRRCLITGSVAMSDALKVRKIENSIGVILPRTILEDLDVEEGDELFAVQTPDGIQLIPHDPELVDAVEDAREFMRTHRNAFRELA